MRCPCDYRFGSNLGLTLMIIGGIKMFDNFGFIGLVLIGVLLNGYYGHKYYKELEKNK